MTHTQFVSFTINKSGPEWFKTRENYKYTMKTQEPSQGIFVVCGATSGFGRGVAEKLLESGKNILAVARDKQKLKALKAGCSVVSFSMPVDLLPNPLKKQRWTTGTRLTNLCCDGR